jgi:hypothetical protein
MTADQTKTMTANNAADHEGEQSAENENVPIRHIQTVRIGCDERGRIRLQLTEAIRAAGLGDSDDVMFRYVPEEVDNLGVVPALGMEESVTSPRDSRTYSVDNAGGRNRLEISEDVLTALDIDIDAVKAGNGPLLDVFAGDRMIAFDKSNAIAVPIDALPDDYEGDANEDGEVILHQAQTTTPMMRSWGVTARLTAGIRQAGNGAEDDLGAIKYLPELSDDLGDGIVPAIVTQYGDGRARGDAYSLSRVAANSGKSSSRGFEATIPDDVLDALDLSTDDYENVALDDRPALTVYAGDRIVALGRPGEREIDVDREQTPSEPSPALTDIDGIGPALADRLGAAGYETIEDLADATREELLAIDRLGVARADRIMADVTAREQQRGEDR